MPIVKTASVLADLVTEEPQSPAEQPLRTHIVRVEEKLGGLRKDLHVVDGKLSELAPRREQHVLVQNVCDSLERLSALGVSGMFWGARADAREAEEHVRRVREELGDFTAELSGIEESRRALLDEIQQGQHILDILEGDLHEIQVEEEERRREWLIEREIGEDAHRPQRMPWSRVGEDDRRFSKSILSALFAAVFLGAVLPLIPLPVPAPEEAALEVPELAVRFIELRQQREAPPPEPVVAEVPEPEVPEPEPEPVVASEDPPEIPPAEEPAPVAVEEPSLPPQPAGILAFRESFANVADRPAEQLGAQARIGNFDDGDNRVPERSLVTSLSAEASGGINLSSLSRQVGGSGGAGTLEGVDVGRVESGIAAAAPGGASPGAWDGALAGRTDEEIQIVFDRYKSSLYRLYNRELRNDPTLRGQMVLRLTIEPNGTVSMVELRSTDMDAPLLVEQVLERVRTFDFGAKDVAAITIIYPIDFLPAA